MDFENTTFRFFETDGKCFAAKERGYIINKINAKGEDYCIAPYGTKDQTFPDSAPETKILPIHLSDTQHTQLLELEEFLKKKMEKCTDFLNGTIGYKSFLKMLDDKPSMNLKLLKNTKITYFNVQKGAFSKGSIEQICPGQHLYVDLTIGHPWKNEVDRKMYWGFTFYVNEIIILSSQSSQDKSESKRKYASELLKGEMKKKTKMMSFKE